MPYLTNDKQAEIAKKFRSTLPTRMIRFLLEELANLEASILAAVEDLISV